MRIRSILFFVSALICGRAAFADDTVEVLHRWTSPGEAAAVSALKRELSVQGLAWVDMSIPGGDPAGTMTELRKRVMTKDPPTAAVMFFTDAREWARLGALANLNDVAERDGWDRMIPKSMQAASKFEDKWVSVPININLYNSLWASRAALQSAGIAEMPVTWNQFIEALEKLKKKGLIGLAASRQPWELAIIFESVVVATGGADFHRKAFVQRDRAALGSDTMKKVFDRMAQLRGYTDADYTKRDWPASAALVANDKAGFQIMGDWAKGEFTQAGKVAGRDFLCGRTPGTQGTTIYASDQFAMFNLTSGGFRRQNTQQAQARLASAILSAKGQIAFNTAKGSNPVRVDLPEGPFDVCTRGAMQNLQEADKKGGMVVPMARIVSTATRQAILEIIERQFSGKMTSAEAVTTMAAVVE